MKLPWSRRGEIDEELRAHLRMAIQDRVDRGEDPAEAGRRARRELGNLYSIHERTRASWGGVRLERWLRDLRFAFRQMRRTPGFAAVAILTLGLGLGSTTAMFAIVDSILLQPLQYRDPDALYSVVNLPPPGTRNRYWLVNGRHFYDWRAGCRACEDIALAQGMGVTLAGDGEPERVTGLRVSYNFFRTLGVPPALGRDFRPEEELPGDYKKLILSDTIWRSRFGGDPSIVGRTIRVNGEAHVVVGVMPAAFRVPVGEQWGAGFGPPVQPLVFRPLGFDLSQDFPAGNNNYVAVARLKRGVGPDRALAELNAIIEPHVRQHNILIKPRLLPLRETVVQDTRAGLLLLLGVIGTMLLIVCVNVGTLMVVRTASRDREVAVRMALGSNRAQLLSLVAGESFGLVAAGSLLGAAVAYGSLAGFAAWAPPEIARIDEIHLGPRTWWFAAAAAAVSMLISGVLPAWRMTRMDPQAGLKSGASRVTADGGRVRVREWMVGVQVALCTVLLVVAGLLAASFVRLMGAPRGVDVEHVVTLDVSMSGPGYPPPRRLHVIERALEMLAAIPGVVGVGVTNQLPLRGEAWVCTMRPGAAANTPGVGLANFRFVSPGYWAALGIAFRQGRPFAPGDDVRGAAVVSGRAAAALAPGRNPIGSHVASCGSMKGSQTLEIVGVVDDVRAGIDSDAPLTVYVPHWGEAMFRPYFAVRAPRDPQAIIGEMRAALRSIDANLAIGPPATMEQVVDEGVEGRRFHLLLAAACAMFALVLASLGIYGLMSFSVTRRTPELGIRLALGARRSRLAAMIVRQGMVPVIAGVLAGTAVALLFGKLLSSQLYGVTPTDPLTIAVVALILTGVGICACWMPARRAMRINPLNAIRFE